MRQNRLKLTEMALKISPGRWGETTPKKGMLILTGYPKLSASLNRLNAILSLLQHPDRYRTLSAMGSAIGRPYLALSRIPTQAGVLNCLVLKRSGSCLKLRRTQEGCGGLKGENPAAFPQAWPIFQQPFSLPESAQTLAGIAFRAAGKSENNFPAASKFAGEPFQQGISDSHSLLEFSEKPLSKQARNKNTVEAATVIELSTAGGH